MNKSAVIFPENALKHKGNVCGQKKITQTGYLTSIKTKSKYLHFQIGYLVGKKKIFHSRNSILQCLTLKVLKEKIHL